MIREGWKLNKNQEFWEKCLGSIRGWNERTHIFCCPRSIGCFNRNWLLLRVSRCGFSWCWIKRLGQHFRTQSRLRYNGWLLWKNMIRSWISVWEEEELFYLGSWWSRSTKSFPSNSLLGCPLNRLVFWRMIRYNCRDSLGLHQFLQCGCGWSNSWGWTWWLIIYRMSLPVQAWGIKFGVLKRSVRIVGRGIHWIIFLKKGIVNYLTVGSKLSI